LCLGIDGGVLLDSTSECKHQRRDVSPCEAMIATLSPSHSRLMDPKLFRALMTR
jgi:hypothetical protein